MLLIVSALILIFGLAATTRTQNITVGGYYPGLIVSGHADLHVTAGHTGSSACSRFHNMWSKRVSSELFPLLGAGEPNYWKSLRGEFSPHSLFSITVIRGWVRESILPINMFSSLYSAFSIHPPDESYQEGRQLSQFEMLFPTSASYSTVLDEELNDLCAPKQLQELSSHIYFN